MNKNIILLVPEKTDEESEQVIDAWLQLGGCVKKLGKYWIRDEDLAIRKIAIYGNQTFSMILAQIYQVKLISPDDSLIARLDAKWTKRHVELKRLEDLSTTDFPVFIKPVIPKAFTAGIFYDLSLFQSATEELPLHEEILISSIVENITAEARGYVLNGVIKDIALYEGSADLDIGRRFLLDFLTVHKEQLPSTVVIDIAYTKNEGWFVIEFNACWGSGLNNCKAENIIECIIEATIHN